MSKQPKRKPQHTYIGVRCTPELLAAVTELARRRSTPALAITISDVLRAAIVAELERAAMPLAKAG